MTYKASGRSYPTTGGFWAQYPFFLGGQFTEGAFIMCGFDWWRRGEANPCPYDMPSPMILLAESGIILWFSAIGFSFAC